MKKTYRIHYQRELNEINFFKTLEIINRFDDLNVPIHLLMQCTQRMFIMFIFTNAVQASCIAAGLVYDFTNTKYGIKQKVGGKRAKLNKQKKKTAIVLLVGDLKSILSKRFFSL